MLFSTRGIVFRITQYRESSIIAQVYTEQFGLQSYIVNSVRTAKSRYPTALFQPLSLLDMTVYHHPQRAIHRIKECKAWWAYRHLPYDPLKSSVALFLAEVLNKTIHEHTPSQPLFDFLIQSLVQLDEAAFNPNFHLSFLLELSSYAGFQPSSLQEFTATFDWQEDERTSMEQFLFSENKNITATQRRKILDALLHFYAEHVEHFGECKSLDVLRSLT